MTKLKELLELPIGIVGEFEIMKITDKKPKYYYYRNLKEAVEKHGDEEVLQIFGGKWTITAVVFEVKKRTKT